MDLFAAFYSLDLLLFLSSYREMSKVPREQTNKMKQTHRESLQNAIIIVFSAFISEFQWVAYIIISNRKMYLGTEKRVQGLKTLYLW